MEPRSTAEILSAALKLYVHHDQHFWSCVQTLMVLEAATLTTSYAVRDQDPLLALAALVVGTSLVVALAALAKKHEADRDTNNVVFDAVKTQLLPPEVAREVTIQIREYHERRGIKLSPGEEQPLRLTARAYSGLRGRTLLGGAFFIVVSMNAVFAAIVAAGWAAG